MERTAGRRWTLQRVLAWTLIFLSLLMPALVLIENDRSALATGAVLLSPIVLAMGLQRRLVSSPVSQAGASAGFGHFRRRSVRAKAPPDPSPPGDLR
jgi:hypothetical protein